MPRHLSTESTSSAKLTVWRYRLSNDIAADMQHAACEHVRVCVSLNCTLCPYFYTVVQS